MTAIRQLWKLPVRWRLTLVLAFVAPLSAFVVLVVRPGNIVGRSKAMTVNIPAGGCTNVSPIRFAGHAWESDTPVPESWGYGDETGRFRIVSSHSAEFMSDADGKGVEFHRMDGFSTLPCMVGFGA